MSDGQTVRKAGRRKEILDATAMGGVERVEERKNSRCLGEILGEGAS
jgi:hypothetical protein